MYLIYPAINYKLKAVPIFEGEMYSKHMTVELKCINVNGVPALSANLRNSPHFDMHIKLMQKTSELKGIKRPQIYLKKKCYFEMTT